MNNKQSKDDLKTIDKEELFINEVNNFLKTVLHNEIKKVNDIIPFNKNPYNMTLLHYPSIKEDIKKVINSYLIKTAQRDFKFEF